MSGSSNTNGRAYEFAWINALYKSLSPKTNTKIVINSSFYANEKAWNMIDKNMQETFKTSANSAVKEIVKLEPLITENTDDELLLEFQKDEAGTTGDVRDIVIKRSLINWEIGLSIKHNHDAVKHSRLSPTIDFGKEWFSVPCSKDYWNDVNPIFNRLKKEKSIGIKWSETENKESSVYIPLLNAFMNEIKRAYKKDDNVPKKMIEYLIGKNDYYKIVSYDADRLTSIYSFNVHSTLSKPSKTKKSPVYIPTVKLPTEIISLKLKNGSNNTVEMYLNNDWQLSFRIHNASSYVEPSLKFDVRFIKMPSSIIKFEQKWI